MTIVYILVVFILAIFLIVCMVYSRHNWNWAQITFTILIFITAIFAGVLVSRSYKARTAWQKRLKSNQEAAEREQNQYETALLGPDTALEYTADSFRGSTTAVQLEQLGRGRVWSGAIPTIGANVATLQINPADAAADPATAVTSLAPGMRVFLFVNSEVPMADGQNELLPTGFIGFGRVTEVNGLEVKVTPDFINESMVAEFSNPSAPWTLYEKMPADRRDVFRRLEFAPDVPFDISKFREALSAKYLPAEMLGFDPASPAYEAYLDQYTFDTVAMNAIENWINTQPNRHNDKFDPGPEQRRVELIMQNNSQKFPVDATGDISADGPFNRNGQAVDPVLKHGQDIVIAEGDKLVVDKLSGELGYDRDGERQESLMEQENAEKTGELFVRELKDYSELLFQLNRDTASLTAEIARVQANVDETNKAIDNAQKQVNERDDILAKLDADNRNLTQDVADIDAFAAGLDREVNQMRQLIQQYYKQISVLYQQYAARANEIQRSLDDVSR